MHDFCAMVYLFIGKDDGWTQDYVFERKYIHLISFLLNVTAWDLSDDASAFDGIDFVKCLGVQINFSLVIRAEEYHDSAKAAISFWT